MDGVVMIIKPSGPYEMLIVIEILCGIGEPKVVLKWPMSMKHDHTN